MSEQKQMRILNVDAHLLHSVPWSIVSPHEAQALRNHGQSLDRLNERGGVSIRELWAILNGRNGYDGGVPDVAECRTWILEQMKGGSHE
jgi:hypothetical protein